MKINGKLLNGSSKNLLICLCIVAVLLILGREQMRNDEQTPWSSRPMGGLTEINGKPANILGTSGKAHVLKQTRSFKGPRELVVKPKGVCQKSWTQPAPLECDGWIVVTTIFQATKAVKGLAATKGWCMVVVADKKGPVSYLVPNIVYLDVVQQESCGYQICKLLPWNHFGRKNIGYLYAIQHGAKWIYDTDDDNELLANTMPNFEVTFSRVKTWSNVWNPYPTFGPDTRIWPRGFPLSRIKDPATKNLTVLDTVRNENIGVVQYLAQHDPDVDAIYRLTSELPYMFNRDAMRFVVPQKVLSPYNAQATHHARNAFWGMLLPVTVHGRVSDIWRSYFTQRLLWDIGKNIAFHSPAVVQYRNPHNYMADFDSEMDLYYKTDNLVKFLLEWTPSPSSTSLEQRLYELQIQLYEYGFVEADDVALTEAWIQDLNCLGYEFPKVKD